MKAWPHLLTWPRCYTRRLCSSASLIPKLSSLFCNKYTPGNSEFRLLSRGVTKPRLFIQNFSVSLLTSLPDVYTIVTTMNKYTATVIKTGNSYALRVPKNYVDDAHLELGQKVQVTSPITTLKKQDPQAIKKAIRNLQEVGAYKDIKDPVAWQREIRKDRPLPGRG